MKLGVNHAHALERMRLADDPIVKPFCVSTTVTSRTQASMAASRRSTVNWALDMGTSNACATTRRFSKPTCEICPERRI